MQQRNIARGEKKPKNAEFHAFLEIQGLNR